MAKPAPTTSLCRYTDTEIYYRDRNLTSDLLTEDADFVSVMMQHILGREVSAAQKRVMQAILITMMEHGLTPSAIATRSIYMSAPENLQGAVAGGLLAIGSQFVGTIENNAQLLTQLVDLDQEAQAARATEIVREYRARKERLPGFGHHLHSPDDPRALKLMEIGEAESMGNKFLPALQTLSVAVDAEFDRHITINATGATAALLGDMGIPVELMRGFAVISRAAGLVAHIAEEQERPSGRFIWETVEKNIPFEG